MLKHTTVTFFSGVAIGVTVLPVWALIWFYKGFWWGAAAVLLGFGLALKFVFLPAVNSLHRKVAEAVALVLWAGKHWVEHADPSSPGGTYRGTALSLITAYRNEWALDDQINLLRDLKAKGQADGRNPDNGRLFSVVLNDSLAETQTQ